MSVYGPTVPFSPIMSEPNQPKEFYFYTCFMLDVVIFLMYFKSSITCTNLEMPKEENVPLK